MQLKITDTDKVTLRTALLTIPEQEKGKFYRLLEKDQLSIVDMNLMEMSGFQSCFQKGRLFKLFSPVTPDDVLSSKPDRLLAHVPRMHWDQEVSKTE